MRFWGAQGLCGTGTQKLDWRLLGTLFVPGGNLPCSAHVWQGHPKSCRRGKVIQNSARKGQQIASPKAATCCTTPGVGLAGAGGGFLTPRTAETGSTCATAFPPQSAREESRWDCKSRVSSSHAEEAPLHTGFVPRALSEPALPLLGMLTTATFGKRRPGCALWLKFAGFLLAKPLKNQPSCWTVPLGVRQGLFCVCMDGNISQISAGIVPLLPAAPSPGLPVLRH